MFNSGDTKEGSMEKHMPSPQCFKKWNFSNKKTKKLRWFPENMRAVMAQIKLSNKPHGISMFWIQLKKDVLILKLSSWPREKKINLKLSIFQFKKTFHVSWKPNNVRFIFRVIPDFMLLKLASQDRIWYYRIRCDGIE